MKFRPCIDIHNGKVKQIVGGSLNDDGNQAVENYTAENGAEYFARMYREDGLTGGHIILLNPPGSEPYQKTKEQAVAALHAYPGGMQIGGGITAENAKFYLSAGASHIIVTSYVFRDGTVQWDNMRKLRKTVGKEQIVIDLSCRRKGDDYYIVTDRWQKFTNEKLTGELLDKMSDYCDEYLVHGVDVEGHASGFQEELVGMLGAFGGIPVTYAGGIGSMADLRQFEQVSGGRLDFTVGSALDLFGGKMEYKELVNIGGGVV